MKLNFPSWSKTMEPLVKEIEKKTSVKYMPSCDLIGKKITVSSYGVVERDGYSFVTVRFNMDNVDYFTCTWHPQPVELIRIIKEEMNSPSLTVFVRATKDKLVEYSFY